MRRQRSSWARIKLSFETFSIHALIREFTYINLIDGCTLVQP